MADLDTNAVAERLRDRATRTATLDALERHAAPLPTAAALAAAPALLELMTMDAAEVERGAYDRAGLLLGRLLEEALPAITAVFGAAFGDGGLASLWNSDSVLNAALRQPAAQLTRADAASYACAWAYDPIASAQGFTAPWAAAGLTGREWMGLLLGAEPIVSKKKLPEDDVQMKLMTLLLLELLKSNELPELATGGAWMGVHYCLTGHLGLGPAALGCVVFELAVAHLHAIGSPADWISSRAARRAERMPYCFQSTMWPGVLPAKRLGRTVPLVLIPACSTSASRRSQRSPPRAPTGCATHTTARCTALCPASEIPAHSPGARPRSAAWRGRWTSA